MPVRSRCTLETVKRSGTAKKKREPLCTECSHGEPARPVNDPGTTLHPPATRLEQYLTTIWHWWRCGHCNSVWVVWALVPGVEKRRIGYLEDGTFAWHDAPY